MYIKKESGKLWLMAGDPATANDAKKSKDDIHITEFTPTATNLLGKGNSGKAQKETILANDKKPNIIQRGIQKVKDAVKGKAKNDPLDLRF